MLDHPRSTIAGISSVLKFGLDPIYSFGNIAIFIFCRFWLKLPIHAFFFGGGGWCLFPPNNVAPRSNPKRHFIARKQVVWAIKRENRFSGSTWARSWEKRTGQDRTGQDSQTKKSQSRNISPVFGRSPTVPIRTKIYMMGHLADIITCAKFQVENFGGYDFTGGRISHFPFLHGPYKSAARLRCLWYATPAMSYADHNA